MICVYDIGNTTYTRNGNVALLPTECTCTEDAGGSYELTLTHPLDKEGRWQHLVCGAVIRVPVPVAPFESSYSGQDADVYTTNTSAPLRTGPSDTTPVSYQTWVSGTQYAYGTKVTYSGHNYEKITQDVSPMEYNAIAPPNLPSWWRSIADYVPGGAPILTTLPSGTEVYFVSTYNSTWTVVQTKTGIQGYVRTSQITFTRHEHVTPIEPHTVTEQLFRIYNVQLDNAAGECSVSARHVSYDFAGVLIRDCSISLAQPALALMRIEDGMMMGYRGTISTNLTPSENGTYTGDVSGHNGVYALLDPDKGIVNYFRAKLQRDNWDFYIFKNVLKNRGFRITRGVNMIGVTWTRDSSDLVTRVVPIAKAADGSDLYLPELYVDSSNINNYPVVVMERLKVDGQVGKDDGSGTGTNWTEANLLAHMRTKAGERFSVDHADAVVNEVDVNFLMLGDTAEYREYHELEKLYLYDVVKVRDPEIGMDLTLQVASYSWDCIRERYNSIKVGNVFSYGGRTVWGYNVGDGAISYEKISIEAVRKIQSET